MMKSTPSLLYFKNLLHQAFYKYSPINLIVSFTLFLFQLLANFISLQFLLEYFIVPHKHILSEYFFYVFYHLSRSIYSVFPHSSFWFNHLQFNIALYSSIHNFNGLLPIIVLHLSNFIEIFPSCHDIRLLVSLKIS